MAESSDQSDIMTDINTDFEFFHTAPESESFITVIAAPFIFGDEVDAFNIFVEQRVVPLTPSEGGQSFDFLENLILTVNQHANFRDYAVILHRTKKSKLEMKKKT